MGALSGGAEAAIPDAAAPKRARARAGGWSGISSSQAWGFALRFVALWLLALGIASWKLLADRWAVDFTVANLSWVLRIASAHPEVAGSSVSAGGANIRIIPDCTPLMPTLALWAAMLAFPASLRHKTLGLAGGAIAVWAFNLARVLALMGVLVWAPRHFHFVHVYLWQTGTLLVVLGLFVLWVRMRTDAPRAK